MFAPVALRFVAHEVELPEPAAATGPQEGMSMSRIMLAATLYVLAVFAVAFLLGAVRVMWIVPRVGPFWAVAVEVPLVIAVSWVTCKWVLARIALAGTVPHLAMGVLAFGILMVLEAGLAVLVFGQTLTPYLASMATPSGALGLAGQFIFAFVPAIQHRVRTRRRCHAS